MKFNVRVKEFIKGVEPALSVATKGTVHNYQMAGLVTVEAIKEGIFLYGCGGRMSIKNELSKKYEDENDLNFACVTPGRFTVKAVDIKATLASFAPTDIISVELRTDSTAKQDDKSADASSEEESEEKDDGVAAQLAAGQEVVCTLLADQTGEQFQTMPCFQEHIAMPQYVIDFMEDKKKLNDAFKIRRDLFVYASNKILFARGFEEGKESYMYWVIRAKQNSLRFVAGSGARFAILDVDGDDISNVKKEKNVNLLIPNEQTQPILDIVSGSMSEMLNFICIDKWMIIECGTFVAAISNYESDITWPDENTFLTRKNSMVFTTKISDWANVVRGIVATYDQDMKKQHDVHYATLDINLGKKELATKTDGMMKSSRKIPIKGTKVIDDSASKDGKMLFTCVSKYIAEAIKHGSEDECVQIELENTRKPVIFRYHAPTDGTISDPKNFVLKNSIYNIDERFSIFFAPKKKV